MAAPLIEEILTAANATSKEVQGYELGRNEAHNYAGVRQTNAGYQAIRVANAGNYVVRLEAGFRLAGGTIHWGTVAMINQDMDSVVTAFNLVPGAWYRFARASGVDVRVVLN